MLTPVRLREALDYDTETGHFTWRAPAGQKARILLGKRAGYRDPSGYITIRIDRRLYEAHRLAWLFVKGEWPPDDIDHANGDPSDNRLANLRAATRQQNMANKRIHKNNASGVKGVHFHPQSGKWRAQIRVDRRTRHIGLYAKKEEAAKAYLAAATKAFGDFASDGNKEGVS